MYPFSTLFVYLCTLCGVFLVHFLYKSFTHLVPFLLTSCIFPVFLLYPLFTLLVNLLYTCCSLNSIYLQNNLTIHQVSPGAAYCDHAMFNLNGGREGEWDPIKSFKKKTFRSFDVLWYTSKQGPMHMLRRVLDAWRRKNIGCVLLWNHFFLHH